MSLRGQQGCVIFLNDRPTNISGGDSDINTMGSTDSNTSKDHWFSLTGGQVVDKINLSFINTIIG